MESKATQAAKRQKTSYDLRSTTRVFNVNDPVWLSLWNVGKLDPRWGGKWHVNRVINPINLEITDGVRTKAVHVNRLRHRVQPQPGNGSTGNLNTFVPADSALWVSPQVVMLYHQPLLNFQHCRGDTPREKGIL